MEDFVAVPLAESDVAVPAPGPQFIDTHAHIHFNQYAGRVNHVLRAAHDAGVGKLITVGVSTDDSRRATELAFAYDNVWAAVGIHPHEAAEAEQGISYLEDLAGRRRVVAIGECGLDFYKATSSHEQQEQALRLQVELAQKLELPLIFHVRDAFPAFFKIMDEYPNLPAVVHSFTAGPQELAEILKRGWHVALNGITTFTKDEQQLTAIKQLPLDRMLLETDCPFLSPVPFRGKTNEPARIINIGEFLAELRNEPLTELAERTTRNAQELFGL